MTEERMQQCELAMMRRYNDLKKRRELLKESISLWAKAFELAALRLKGQSGHQPFDLAKLPEKQEVLDGTADYADTCAQIASMQKSFREMNLDIE